MDAALIAEARIANEQLAAEGFKLLGSARYEEALMVAQSVLQADPVSVQGHALKGDVLERKGDLPGAIAAYEQVLELQPDATLEKIKLTHAKNVLSERAALAPRPNKRIALLAGLSAVVFVACIGALAALVNKDRLSPKTEGTIDRSSIATQRPDPQINVPRPEGLNSDSKGGDGQSPTQGDPAQKPKETGNEQPAQDKERDQVTAEASRNSNSQLPDARTNSTRKPPPMDGEVRPAQPNLSVQPINPRPENPGTTTTASNADPDPTPVNNSGNAGRTETSAPSQGRPNRPVIDVKPSDNNSGKIGGSDSKPSTGGSLSTKVKQARDAMLAGNYSEAAGLFESALASGADPGINNQHLATCYERTGRKGEAIRCYEQAASTYERRITNGDTSARTKSAAETCRQAAKALRG